MILFLVLCSVSSTSSQDAIVRQFQNESFYFEVTEFANYEESKVHCSGFNSSLLIISSSEMDNFVHETLRQSNITAPYLFYIGLKRASPVRYDFLWIDGTKPLDNSLWRRNQPIDDEFPEDVESCVAIDITTRPLPTNETYEPAMLTCDCNNKLHYICRFGRIFEGTSQGTFVTNPGSNNGTFPVNTTLSQTERNDIPIVNVWLLFLLVLAFIALVLALILLYWVKKYLKLENQSTNLNQRPTKNLFDHNQKSEEKIRDKKYNKNVAVDDKESKEKYKASYENEPLAIIIE